MPTGFAAAPSRRPIALIAIWLVVMQAFLAGVVAARTAAMPAADPLTGVICHGSGGAGPAGGTTPESTDLRHLCCAYCTSLVPAVAPRDPPSVSRPRQASRLAAYSSFIIVIARGTIRAGPARAPPTTA